MVDVRENKNRNVQSIVMGINAIVVYVVTEEHVNMLKVEES